MALASDDAAEEQEMSCPDASVTFPVKNKGA